MTKAWPGNFFEDFELGAAWRCPTPRRLTHGDVSAYIALTGDRTPGYCGGGDLVHPLVVFHTVFGQTVRSISLNARANLGYADLRWHRPARVGDVLVTDVEIVGLKENSSGTTGIVWVKTTGRDVSGEAVLSFTRWVMVKKRGTAPTAWRDAPVVPELGDVVDPSTLSPTIEAARPDEAAGARWGFADYAVGERIVHGDGMLVNPSDHMAFTRLFQNSAKVHFDGLAMDGRPLVYGGVVISHCYAAAHNGLEGRAGVCGINGGTHANPVYAGDTVYAVSEVLDTFDPGAGSPVGLVRLRLVGIKNTPASEHATMQWKHDDPKRPGRTRYAPNVVLDLDLWESVAK